MFKVKVACIILMVVMYILIKVVCNVMGGTVTTSFFFVMRSFRSGLNFGSKISRWCKLTRFSHACFEKVKQDYKKCEPGFYLLANLST